jgi:hypothetical protein
MCCERVIIGSSCVEKKSFLVSTSAWMRENMYICVWSMNSTLGSQQGRDFACTRVQFGHTLLELRTNSWVTAEDLALFTRQAFLSS